MQRGGVRGEVESRDQYGVAGNRNELPDATRFSKTIFMRCGWMKKIPSFIDAVVGFTHVVISYNKITSISYFIVVLPFPEIGPTIQARHKH